MAKIIVDKILGKARQGDDVAFEIINNLTTPRSDAALSAEMGVQLAKQIVTPDNEDIIAIPENEQNILQFKDRAYNPETFSGKGFKILRKNIVEAQNILTQAMLSQPNTVYHIRYDYTLADNIVMPENCTLHFDGGAIAGDGSIELANTKLTGEIQLGILIAGPINNEALNSRDFTDKSKFIDSINKVQGCTSIVFEPIEYMINETINIGVGDKVIEGNNCILNSSTSDILYVLRNERDEHSSKTPIAAYANKGDRFITVVNPDLFQVGDSIAISDITLEWGRGFTECEYSSIIKIEENKLYLRSSLYGKYSENGQVTKLFFSKLKIQDITFKGNQNIASKALYLVAIIDTYIDNCSFDNYVVGISNYLSYGLIINNINGSTIDKVSGIDNYGIALLNVQNVRVSNSKLEAGNHAIACGSAGQGSLGVISRDVIYDNIKADIIPIEHSASLDFHPCCEYYKVMNSITRGINCGGGKFSIINNTIESDNDTMSRVNIYNRINNDGIVLGNYFNKAEISCSIIDQNLEGNLIISENVIDNIALYGIYIDSNFSGKMNTLLSITNNTFIRDANLVNKTMFLPNDVIFSNNNVHNMSVAFRNSNQVIVKNNIFDRSYVTFGRNIESTSEYLYIKSNQFTGEIVVTGYIRFESNTNKKIVIIDSNIINPIHNSNLRLLTLSGLFEKISVINNCMVSNVEATYFYGSAQIITYMGNYNPNGVALKIYWPTSDFKAITDVVSTINVDKDKQLGVSSMYPDNPSTIDVSKISLGYQSFHDGKPIWWSGSQWVDGIGNPVIFS